MIDLSKTLKTKTATIKVAKIKVPGADKKELEQIQKRYEKKVQEYALFLAEDYDFDYTSLLRVMIYKISRIRALILKNNIIADAEKIAAQMKEAIDILQKVIDDNYHEEVFKDFYTEHGHPDMVPVEEERTEKSVPVKFIYKNGKEATQEMRKEQRKLYKLSYKMQYEDLKKAMAVVTKNIFSWWE